MCLKFFYKQKSFVLDRSHNLKYLSCQILSWIFYISRCGNNSNFLTQRLVYTNNFYLVNLWVLNKSSKFESLRNDKGTMVRHVTYCLQLNSLKVTVLLSVVDEVENNCSFNKNWICKTCIKVFRCLVYLTQIFNFVNRSPDFKS